MVILQKLKSLIKFNKLFRYKFFVPKDLFYELKIKAYYIEPKENFLICYGNKKLFNQLSEYEIKYINQYHIIFKSIILKRIVFIITFIIICLIFFSSSLFIREIRFKDNTMYDNRIYTYVNNKLNKKWFLYTLKEDLNSISLSLRSAFPNYSYLGLSKQGSTLIIDAEKIDLKKNIKPSKNTLPIISNYNAVIYGISCVEGVVLVNLNQSVKKGEVLVTPNIDGGFCDAIILGTLSEYVTVNVKKKQLKFEYTGKIIKKLNVRVGKNYLNKFKDYYENQEIKIINKINILNYLYLDNLYYYKKDYLLVVYEYDTAYNYAVSTIYTSLELYRKSSLEKINHIILVSESENEEEYIFNFLVNRVKSIGIYTHN